MSKIDTTKLVLSFGLFVTIKRRKKGTYFCDYCLLSIIVTLNWNLIFIICTCLVRSETKLLGILKSQGTEKKNSI